MNRIATVLMLLAAFALPTVVRAQAEQPKTTDKPEVKVPGKPQSRKASATQPLTEKQKWAQLEAEVKAGKITADEARERMVEFERKVRADKKRRANAKQSAAARVAALREKLDAVVASGRMTRAEADTKIKTLEERLAKHAPKVDAKRAAREKAAWAELEAKVKAGELTREEAKTRMAELRKQGATSKPNKGRAGAPKGVDAKGPVPGTKKVVDPDKRDELRERIRRKRGESTPKSSGN